MAPTTPETAEVAALLTVAVTLEAVLVTVPTSPRIELRLSSVAVAESMVPVVFSSMPGICLMAGSSSSAMPSTLAITGWTWAMVSLAEVTTSSMDLRAERTVSASSMTAHIATRSNTSRAMSLILRLIVCPSLGDSYDGDKAPARPE